MSAPIVVWFQQDLRSADHPALAAAAKAGPVICLYVLDDETPGQWRWGGASRWWLHKSLEALGRDLHLVLRRGRADAAIVEILRATGAQAVHFTRDYAPWSGALEARVKAVCEETGAACRRFGGYLLHEPEAIRTGQGEPYKVFTPFARACFAVGDPPEPKPMPAIVPWDGRIASDRLDDWGLLPTKPDWAEGFSKVWSPGEAGARARLTGFLDERLGTYADDRDRLDRAGGSGLSPHLHWGEISPARAWTTVRSAMAEAGGGRDRGGLKFLQELLWRDFSNHLLHHWRDLPEKPFKPEFANFPWSGSADDLQAWRRGRTGYPIVDAGMRELWATGVMHNRARMIAASFLVKHLLIPWQDGARWFWDTLVDADIANNSASWQWVAGSGADAAPYFRIFNPTLQGEKFDPQGAYVRRWVPELAVLPSASIHRPWEVDGIDYPKPIVDHAFARDRALAAFKGMRPRR